MNYPWHNLERCALAHTPTPLEPLKRLSSELGGPTIWVKRDDCTGLALGGNKTRKLELLMGDALSQGADTVITFGAIQSNHARQTAAACAKIGLTCHMVLADRVSRDNPRYKLGGNVLLGKLTGAHQHIVDVEEVAEYTQQLQLELEQTGKSVYVIPAGGSNALGALGYATCVEELFLQCKNLNIAPTHIVHASASAGTQAGLLCGLQQIAWDIKVLGVNVFHPDPSQLEQRVKGLLLEMYKKYIPDTDAPITNIHINHAYFGTGYGQPTKECIAAIETLARLEGLLFDPVYSGKALAAMIDQVVLGNFRHSKDVILIHTGGTPALHVYDEIFPG